MDRQRKDPLQPVLISGGFCAQSGLRPRPGHCAIQEYCSVRSCGRARSGRKILGNRYPSLAISLAASLLVLGCAGRSARPEYPQAERGEIVSLPGPAAASYTTAAVGGSVVDDPSGALAAAFDGARTARGVELIGDSRLTSLSRFIADHVRPDGTLPSQAAIDAAARHLGLVEPTPHFVVVGTDAREGIAERLQQDIEALLAERGYSHYGGVAVDRDGIALYVAALVFRFVELEPVPRRIEPGTSITLVGNLTHGHIDPELAITEPDGHVARGAPSRGGVLRFDVPVKTRGVYRVELLGQGSQGITVVANFPVYVGEDPPSSVELTGASGEPIDAARATHALLEMINAERTKVQLPAVELDATLSQIADAHVADMLEHGFVAHTSKTTGSAADRVARGGVKTAIVLENIGRGYSLREVHDGLLASPGHRGNILHDQVNRVGIGVRATPESGHTAYLVTELFTRATPKLGSDADEDLLRDINARRRQLGRKPLESDDTLRALAARTAKRYFTQSAPTDQELMQNVRDELGRAKLPARTVGAVLTIASSTKDLVELEAVLEPQVRLIGIGLSQGTRADTPENALCAVLLLGQ